MFGLPFRLGRVLAERHATLRTYGTVNIYGFIMQTYEKENQNWSEKSTPCANTLLEVHTSHVMRWTSEARSHQIYSIDKYRALWSLSSMSNFYGNITIVRPYTSKEWKVVIFTRTA